MAEISASMVKQLRDRTGAGMVNCKNALIESGGDLEVAVDLLRKSGLAAANKKAGRIAADGVIAIKTDGQSVVMVELNSETDFVAKNEKFQDLTKKILDSALEHKVIHVEELLNLPCAHSAETIQGEITSSIMATGEKISLRRLEYHDVAESVVGSYIHSMISPGIGTIGVLVFLENAPDVEEVRVLAKHLAMHIAASKPEYLQISDIPSNIIQKEKDVLKEQAVSTGSAAGILEKMIEGRMRKFYQEVVLMEQFYAIDNKLKIADMINLVAEKVGTKIKISKFLRYEVGEGIEKTENDFAAEVAAMQSQH